MTRPSSVDEAIAVLRERPGGPALLADLYLDGDPTAAARRFAGSGEWASVRELLGDVDGLTVVDVGAGGGVASLAFAEAGASVVAVEPDRSPTVGWGRLRQSRSDRVKIVESLAEQIPLRDGTVDIVYCRQVLHHARDLELAVREGARVLRAGGRFLACREHVVAGDAELERFLADHPVHQLVGGEHAYSADRYRAAIEAAGLRVVDHFGPWDSLVNAFPAALTAEELTRPEAVVMAQRMGRAGRAIAAVPGLRAALRRRITRAKPGELHTFLAVKP